MTRKPANTAPRQKLLLSRMETMNEILRTGKDILAQKCTTTIITRNDNRTKMQDGKERNTFSVTSFSSAERVM